MALCRGSLVILFVGVLLLNLMAVRCLVYITPTQNPPDELILAHQHNQERLQFGYLEGLTRKNPFIPKIRCLLTLTRLYYTNTKLSR